MHQQHQQRRCDTWQAGLTPIVELPYAAYLSCGYNQFVEACFMHWLSAGKQPNGLVLRMQVGEGGGADLVTATTPPAHHRLPATWQGFDEGMFGGHFHTANGPPVFGIPGLDVLCFSNG